MKKKKYLTFKYIVVLFLLITVYFKMLLRPHICTVYDDIMFMSGV